MSLATQINVESRRYSGWTDPRYPIGHWVAAATATGDGTAGIFVIDLVFQGAVPPFLNSQMYSVERIASIISDNSGFVARIGAVNMSGPSNLGFTQDYAVTYDAITAAPGAALRVNTIPRLPWFLGSQRTAGLTASLSLTAQNVDLRIFTFEGEGYIWGPRSVLVDGGPQRPPTGLYVA